MTLRLTVEQAILLKEILNAVCKNFRRYPGMNIGSSQVHNLYNIEIDMCFKLSDEIEKKME